MAPVGEPSRPSTEDKGIHGSSAETENPLQSNVRIRNRFSERESLQTDLLGIIVSRLAFDLILLSLGQEWKGQHPVQTNDAIIAKIA